MLSVAPDDEQADIRQIAGRGLDDGRKSATLL
jgi:hypothetical protein